MSNLLLGYLISVVVGIPVTYVWSEFLHGKIQNYRTEEDRAAGRVWWIPLLIGVFERTIITTFLVFSISGIAGFIGAWIAVKSAGGWATWNKGTTYGRATLFVGLLGSAMSIFLAYLGSAIAATTTLSPVTIPVATRSTEFELAGILIELATLLILAIGLILAMRQVSGIRTQLQQASTHNLLGLSNQHNWALFDRYKSEDLVPMLLSWDGLSKTGWSWRVLILNHLNLLLGVYQENRSKIMEDSDLRAWVKKGQYWFENLRSEDSKYQEGREVLKKILRPEEGYSEKFIQWLISKKIISEKLLSEVNQG